MKPEEQKIDHSLYREVLAQRDQQTTLANERATRIRELETEIGGLRSAVEPLALLVSQFDCPRSGSPGEPDSASIPVKLGELRALGLALKPAPVPPA